MKKLLVAMLALAMAASLSACSGSSTASTTAAAETEAAETEAATEAAETEAAEIEAAEEALADDFSDIDFSEYTMVDISHMVQDEMPADPALKLPSKDFFSEIEDDNDVMYNLEVISYCPHTGTHMDAPFHVLDDQGTIESVDPEVLMGPACVIRLDVDGDYTITVEDIQNWEAEHGEIQAGEAVLFDTNHDQIWESDPEEYITNYPHLEEESAQYLVDKGARFVGCEAISPDTSAPVCHKILLGGGTEIVENVCNLDQIGADRCYIVGTFSAVQGSTGVWTRLLAY